MDVGTPQVSLFSVHSGDVQSLPVDSCAKYFEALKWLKSVNQGEAMKSGVCPKCQSVDVYRSTESPHPHELVALKDGIVTKSVMPDKYVCATCGYLEYYLSDRWDRAMVREKWERITP